MPVVIGQAIVAPCFFASALRMASIVVSLPRRTFFIAASTSSGAGMTNVPSPHRFVFVQSISATLGKSLLSASFSRQERFFAILQRIPIDTSDSLTTETQRARRRMKGDSEIIVETGCPCFPVFLSIGLRALCVSRG